MSYAILDLRSGPPLRPAKLNPKYAGCALFGLVMNFARHLLISDRNYVYYKIRQEISRANQRFQHSVQRPVWKIKLQQQLYHILCELIKPPNNDSKHNNDNSNNNNNNNNNVLSSDEDDSDIESDKKSNAVDMTEFYETLHQRGVRRPPELTIFNNIETTEHHLPQICDAIWYIAVDSNSQLATIDQKHKISWKASCVLSCGKNENNWDIWLDKKISYCLNYKPTDTRTDILLYDIVDISSKQWVSSYYEDNKIEFTDCPECGSPRTDISISEISSNTQTLNISLEWFTSENGVKSARKITDLNFDKDILGGKWVIISLVGISFVCSFSLGANNISLACICVQFYRLGTLVLV